MNVVDKGTIAVFTIIILCCVVENSVLGCNYCGTPYGLGCRACTCYYDEVSGNLEWCSGAKDRKLCALVPSTGCLDANRQASFNGSLYENAEGKSEWHDCGGDPECGQTNAWGINYIGSMTCYCSYYGCN